MSVGPRRGILLFGLGTVLAVVCLWGFWDVVGVWIAPKLVLRNAVQRTYASLETRFENHPILLLTDMLDGDGKYSADFQLTYFRDNADPLLYNGEGMMDLHEGRILTNGVIRVGEAGFDISIYLDREMAAICPGDQRENTFYGVNFSCFESDLQSLPLASLFSQTPILREIKQSLYKLESYMSKIQPIPRIPQVDPMWVETLMMAIMILPGKSESSSCWLDSDRTSCKVTYSIDQSYGNLLDKAGVSLGEPFENIQFSFVLYKNSLVQIDGEITTEKGGYNIAVRFAEDPENGPLSVSFSRNEGGYRSNGSLKLITHSSDDYQTETWEIRADGFYGGIDTTFACSRIKDKGTLEFVNREGQSVSCVLQQTDAGIFLSVSDCFSLVNILSGKNQPGSSSGLGCSLALEKGEPVKIPAYKNLNQWSLDEFGELLLLFGTLLGLQL